MVMHPMENSCIAVMPADGKAVRIRLPTPIHQRAARRSCMPIKNAAVYAASPARIARFSHDLCWLHRVSAGKIERFPLQLPGSLTTVLSTYLLSLMSFHHNGIFFRLFHIKNGSNSQKKNTSSPLWEGNKLIIALSWQYRWRGWLALLYDVWCVFLVRFKVSLVGSWLLSFKKT